MALGVIRPSPNAFSASDDQASLRQLETGLLQGSVLKVKLGPTHGVRTIRPIGEIDRTRGDLRRQAE